MPKLIPLHFVWFINEPRFTDNRERIPYIDSVYLEKVYINAERILAIQSYFDEQYSIPKITPSLEQEENCGVISCVVDDFDKHLEIEYKYDGSLVFFDEEYSYNLNKYILQFSTDSYQRIFNEELSNLEINSFVIYESPEEIIGLTKGKAIDTPEGKFIPVNPPFKKDRIIRPNEARKMLGIGKTTFQDWQYPESKRYRPDFPKKIKLGKNSTGYLESDILAYIDKMKRMS